MKYLVLRFILTGGAFIETVMEEKRAKETVRKWQHAGLTGILGEHDHEAGAWAVKCDQIIGMHTRELPSPVPSASPWKGSGL